MNRHRWFPGVMTTTLTLAFVAVAVVAAEEGQVRAACEKNNYQIELRLDPPGVELHASLKTHLYTEYLIGMTPDAPVLSREIHDTVSEAIYTFPEPNEDPVCLRENRCYKFVFEGDYEHPLPETSVSVVGSLDGQSMFFGEIYNHTHRDYVQIRWLCTGTNATALHNDWAYKMMHLDKVWSSSSEGNHTHTGKGIRIRIHDRDGVYPDHPDYADRIDPDGSCHGVLEQGQDGARMDGTQVAGIVAGHGTCGRGVATGSTIGSCREPPSSCWLPRCSSQPFDVSIHTRKPRICPGVFRNDSTTDCDSNGDLPNETTPAAYDKDIEELALHGRDGRGVIFVVPVGDGRCRGPHDPCGDVHPDGYATSRYTLTVGTVYEDGRHSTLQVPPPDAALLVSTPFNLFTTSRPDVLGSCEQAWSSLTGPGLVGGVVALMLEVRPELTWRDVQGILAETSRSIYKDEDDEYAHTNAAGVWHSNWYGFGVIDAHQALLTSTQWTLWAEEQSISGSSSNVSDSIPIDGSEYIASEITVEGYSEFVSEWVEVVLHLKHTQPGGLVVTLVSPSGTESVLYPGQKYFLIPPKDKGYWTLRTVRNWGENPNGAWKLILRDVGIYDSDPSEDDNVFYDWELVVYGRTEDGTPPTSEAADEPMEKPLEEPMEEPTEGKETSTKEDLDEWKSASERLRSPVEWAIALLKIRR